MGVYMPTAPRVSTLVPFIRPSIEYGSEVWECNKSLADALESIALKGPKKILDCFSRMCSEVVRGDIGLETSKNQSDKVVVQA